MDNRGIGDNGGPPIVKFTAKQKIDRIRDVLEMDITPQQKCVGVGIIVEADGDGIAAELSTKRLQQFASVSDRETVYRATKVLKEEAVAEPIKVRGKPNSYRVLPTNVVTAIVDAYNQSKSGPVEPDTSSPVKPDTHVGSNQTALTIDAVGYDGTALSNHVGSNPTTKESFPHTPFKETKTNNQQKQQTTTTVETNAARGGGEDYLDNLNGTALEITTFIAKHARVEQDIAQRMLANNVKAYTQQAMLEAYSITLAEMATGLVPNAYKYLIGVAANVRDRAAKRRAKSEADSPEGRRERRQKMLDEVAEKIDAEQGRRRTI